MPYKSVKSLPIQTAKLTDDEKEVWMKAFNSAYSNYNDDETAFKVAWAAVEKFKNASNKITAKLKRRK